MTLTLVGGPAVLIEFGSIRLLSEPAGVGPASPAGMGKRASKAAGAALDAVLLGDGRGCRADLAARVARLAAPPRRTCATRQAAARLGGNAIGLAPFETSPLCRDDGSLLLVTATPVGHDAVGDETIGFALGADRPGDLLYVAGAAVWHEGMAEVADRFAPRAVLLFAAAFDARGIGRAAMSGDDALRTARAFPGATLVAAGDDGHARPPCREPLALTFARVGLAGRLKFVRKGRPLAITG
ncbi:MBL fold metallo-hydrolase [Burkholderia perseverans]|uniref:MBL fold metallo-hydrolase n=1 Tax=Burkholderia perseverans TaxID=2615214 RepID=UPI001FEE8ED0|nr:MBL fold metallo-hydrolase [Burkholderia perseverans]